jgi:hypothetical protein
VDYESPRKGDWKGRSPTDSPKSKVRPLWPPSGSRLLTVLLIGTGSALLLLLPIKNIHLLCECGPKGLIAKLLFIYLITFNGLV